MVGRDGDAGSSLMLAGSLLMLIGSGYVCTRTKPKLHTPCTTLVWKSKREGGAAVSEFTEFSGSGCGTGCCSIGEGRGGCSTSIPLGLARTVEMQFIIIVLSLLLLGY